MTIDQERTLQALFEERERRMKQVSAINGRYEALYELLKYASQRLARADENIQRVMIGRPMIEEDIQDVTDISEYIY